MVNKKETFLGKKMLVIGDDAHFLNSIELMFLYAGVDIVIFDVFKKGLSSIETQKPDLILFESSFGEKDFNQQIESLIVENHLSIPLVVISDVNISNNTKITKTISKTNLNIVDLIRTIEDILKHSTNVQNFEELNITEKNLNSLPTTSKEIRVLVVEDDPLLRNLLSVKLTKSKIPYHFCHNGNDVIDIAFQYKPTLIILDLMLPGKNGIDVLNEMRKVPDFEKTPVIIFSNKDNDEDKKKAKLLGVSDFLIKAMTDLNDLVSLIISKH